MNANISHEYPDQKLSSVSTHIYPSNPQQNPMYNNNNNNNNSNMTKAPTQGFAGGFQQPRVNDNFSYALLQPRRRISHSAQESGMPRSRLGSSGMKPSEPNYPVQPSTMQAPLLLQGSIQNQNIGQRFLPTGYPMSESMYYNTPFFPSYPSIPPEALYTQYLRQFHQFQQFQQYRQLHLLLDGSSNSGISEHASLPGYTMDFPQSTPLRNSSPNIVNRRFSSRSSERYPNSTSTKTSNSMNMDPNNLYINPNMMEMLLAKQERVQRNNGSIQGQADVMNLESSFEYNTDTGDDQSPRYDQERKRTKKIGQINHFSTLPPYKSNLQRVRDAAKMMLQQKALLAQRNANTRVVVDRSKLHEMLKKHKDTELVKVEKEESSPLPKQNNSSESSTQPIAKAADTIKSRNQTDTKPVKEPDNSVDRTFRSVESNNSVRIQRKRSRSDIPIRNVQPDPQSSNKSVKRNASQNSMNDKNRLSQVKPLEAKVDKQNSEDASITSTEAEVKSSLKQGRQEKHNTSTSTPTKPIQPKGKAQLRPTRVNHSVVSSKASSNGTSNGSSIESSQEPGKSVNLTHQRTKTQNENIPPSTLDKRPTNNALQPNQRRQTRTLNSTQTKQTKQIKNDTTETSSNSKDENERESKRRITSLSAARRTRALIRQQEIEQQSLKKEDKPNITSTPRKRSAQQNGKNQQELKTNEKVKTGNRVDRRIPSNSSKVTEEQKQEKVGISSKRNMRESIISRNIQNIKSMGTKKQQKAEKQ